jgi:hypothetical protein
VKDCGETCVPTHSEKVGAAPTSYHGEGIIPLVATLDGPGNCGGTDARRPCEVRDRGQPPGSGCRIGSTRGRPKDAAAIVRTASAGYFPGVLALGAAQEVAWLGDPRMTVEMASTICSRRWFRCFPFTTEGTSKRDVGEVAELTPYGVGATKLGRP